MARPSRHLDRALLAAGRELLPVHGCSGLTVRQVAEAAGVNIGMFHYHFRTREAYLRAVMQAAYEEMFAQLVPRIATDAASTANLRATLDATSTANLRAALRVIGRFLHANRSLMARILADALGGNEIARDFLRDNFPRHLRVILGLVAAGQATGELKPMAPLQAFTFCAGALAMPMLIGGELAESAGLEAAFRKELRRSVLTEKALDERIDLALIALAADVPRTRRKGEAR